MTSDSSNPQKPVPKPEADTEEFWKGCNNQELRFQKCGECGYVRWPPSYLCPECHSTETSWIISNGKGEIYTYCIFNMAFQESFKEEVPYVTAVIELEEGPHLLSNVIGCDPSDVEIGMPVKVTWKKRGEYTIHQFKPDK